MFLQHLKEKKKKTLEIQFMTRAQTQSLPHQRTGRGRHSEGDISIGSCGDERSDWSSPRAQQHTHTHTHCFHSGSQSASRARLAGCEWPHTITTCCMLTWFAGPAMESGPPPLRPQSCCVHHGWTTMSIRLRKINEDTGATMTCTKR